MMNAPLDRASKRLWYVEVPIVIAVALFTLIWLLPAFQSIKSFVLVHPASGYRLSDVDLNSRQILLGRLNTLVEVVRSQLVRSFGLAPASALPKFEILVPATSRARLDTRLPNSGRGEYVPARMKYPDGSYKKVKVHYRGDSLHHWGFPATSWRVRTRRMAPIDGHRYLDLVLPRWQSAASYYAPLRMAGMMGVLSNEARFIDLYVNGSPHGGIYMLRHRQNEAFLRHHNRLPGDIYVSDMIKRDVFFRESLDFILGDPPWIWEKAAYNNKFDRQSRLPLEVLMRRLANVHDRDSHLRLTRMLDLDAWARLSAWMQLIMATHMYDGHNWTLYYDPGKQTFEPIIADGNGLPDAILELTKGVPGLDLSVTTPLLARLHRDQRFLRLKAHHLAAFFAAGKDRDIDHELEELKAKLTPSLAASRQLDWMQTTSGRPIRYIGASEFVARLETYRNIVSIWFAKQKKLLLLHSENVTAAKAAPDLLQIRIAGYAPIAKLRFTVQRSGNTPIRARLAGPEGAENKSYGDLTPHLKVQGDRLELTLALLAHRKLIEPEKPGPLGTDTITWPAPFRWLLAVPTTYSIILEGATLAKAMNVEAFDMFGNRLAIPITAKLQVAGTRTDNLLVVPPAHKATVWSGEVSLSGETEIPGDLTIRAGTAVIMGPGANLFVRGRLMVEGTARAPVTFRPRDATRPWGTVAVVGPGTQGSTLRHCAFSGGSGFVTPLAFFSGMVSFRQVRGLRIDNCSFEKNHTYDDLVHLVYSDAHITNSTFRSARSDAVDLDISQVYFENVTFENAGNDTLDLMTSEVAVVASRFSGAGDKGISVGEKSTLAVADSTLADNAIGIQVKDASVAYLLRTGLINNNKHVSSYHKNLSYAGDVAVVMEHSRITGTGASFELKDGARIFSIDSKLGANGEKTEGVYSGFASGSAEHRRARSVIDAAMPLLRRSGHPPRLGASLSPQ